MNISYVVPVYNVFEYISRCVSSLVRQGVSKCEVLLIDDGSTDQSGRLCDELAAYEGSVIVIHQGNRGLSGARNTGIRLAQGRYILFVDSDDWLVDNTVSSIYKEASDWNLDVGVADFQICKCDEIIQNTVIPIQLSWPIDGKDFFLQNMIARSNLNTVWKSIYKRTFIIDSDLWFTEGFNHEDEEWTPRVYIKAKRVKSIPIVFYNYYDRETSISNNRETYEKNSLDLIHNCCELKELSIREMSGELRDTFQDRIANLYLSSVYKGKLIYPRHRMSVRTSFFDGLYLESKTREKVILFRVSRVAYYYINYIIKHILNSKSHF